MYIARAGLIMLLGCAFALPGHAQTQDIETLKDQLTKLEKELAQVKQQLDAVHQDQKAGSQEPVPLESPEGMQVPTPPNTFDVYGFAMLDSGYDFGTIQ